MAQRSFGFLPIALVLVVLFVAFSESIRVDRNVAQTWCVAKPGASDAALQQDIDTICSQLDCGPIQPGGACYEPNTVADHASFALDLFYKSHESQQSACDWGGSAWQIVTNPSHGNCQYP